MAYKRILTIQDVSCVGQCSMTVALPILSAWGLETCILPTALLSTHTGGFGTPTVLHFDDQLEGILAHWQKNNLTFDAVLVGYLGSVAAVAAAEKVLDTMLAPGGIGIVDPAMADHGKLYAGLDAAYAKAVCSLCRKADILLPNFTEAAMLCQEPLQPRSDKAYACHLLEKLNHSCVILTGVSDVPEEIGACLWQNGKVQVTTHPRIGRNFHGTGDIFAACFTGALLQGMELPAAVRLAGEFTCTCLEKTPQDPNHPYGVRFEEALPELISLRAGL